MKKIKIFIYNLLCDIKNKYPIIKDILIASMNIFGGNKVKMQGKRNQIVSGGGYGGENVESTLLEMIIL